MSSMWFFGMVSRGAVYLWANGINFGQLSSLQLKEHKWKRDHMVAHAPVVCVHVCGCGTAAAPLTVAA